ncbi:hypothetical protein WDA79_02100 [Streptomyces sp. A475]|uniref:hypothetical protein n=1 Tax=Streptomyces sp. A475 TaxID=3131976 RepID=UPI0030C96994
MTETRAQTMPTGARSHSPEYRLAAGALSGLRSASSLTGSAPAPTEDWARPVPVAPARGCGVVHPSEPTEDRARVPGRR